MLLPDSLFVGCATEYTLGKTLERRGRNTCAVECGSYIATAFCGSYSSNGDSLSSIQEKLNYRVAGGSG